MKTSHKAQNCLLEHTRIDEIREKVREQIEEYDTI